MNLVDIGTSVRSPSRAPDASRTKVMTVCGKESTSPTSTFDASALLGNFFITC